MLAVMFQIHLKKTPTVVSVWWGLPVSTSKVNVGICETTGGITSSKQERLLAYRGHGSEYLFLEVRFVLFCLVRGSICSLVGYRS